MKKTNKMLAVLATVALTATLAGCSAATATESTAPELPYTADPIGVEGLTATADTALDTTAETLEDVPEGAEVLEGVEAPEGMAAVKTSDGHVSYVAADKASAAVSSGHATSTPSASVSAPAGHVHNHSGSYDYIAKEAAQIWHDPVYESVFVRGPFEGCRCPEQGIWWCCFDDGCSCTGHYENRLVNNGYYETIPAVTKHVDKCSCGYVW